MDSIDCITEQQQIKHRYHHAALYPLYKYAQSHPAEGNTRIWIKKRWDPRKSIDIAEYGSVTLEIYTHDDKYTLESWVFESNLIILIMDVETTGSSRLQPSENYHVDLYDPNCLEFGKRIISRFIGVEPLEKLTPSQMNKMTIYFALSGAWNYSLRPFVPDYVYCIDHNVWSDRNIKKAHTDIEAIVRAETARAGTVRDRVELIGFSAGAIAALKISQLNQLVTTVHAHSPVWREHGVRRTDLEINLYGTKSDTTPSNSGVAEVSYQYRSQEARINREEWFDVEPWPNNFQPRFYQWQYWWSQRKNHQFHNCVPLIFDEYGRNSQ